MTLQWRFDQYSSAARVAGARDTVRGRNAMCLSPQKEPNSNVNHTTREWHLRHPPQRPKDKPQRYAPVANFELEPGFATCRRELSTKVNQCAAPWQLGLKTTLIDQRASQF